VGFLWRKANVNEKGEKILFGDRTNAQRFCKKQRVAASRATLYHATITLNQTPQNLSLHRRDGLNRMKKEIEPSFYEAVQPKSISSKPGASKQLSGTILFLSTTVEINQ
jgi:hypothetical protein